MAISALEKIKQVEGWGEGQVTIQNRMVREVLPGKVAVE